MTVVYERQSFSDFTDRDSARTFSDLIFRRCSFTSCSISITKDPRLRSIVRNVEMADCEVRGCDLDAAVVEDLRVHNLKTHGLFQAWGAAYKHVTLSGKIGRIMLSAVSGPMDRPEVLQAFSDANAKYYSTVDWSLDISKGEFEECELRGIPARTVRRDPETQVIVTRLKAMEGKWRDLDLSKTTWQIAIELLLERGDPDEVFVAAKRDRQFKRELEGLKLLRKAGVAEPE